MLLNQLAGIGLLLLEQCEDLDQQLVDQKKEMFQLFQGDQDYDSEFAEIREAFDADVNYSIRSHFLLQRLERKGC